MDHLKKTAEPWDVENKPEWDQPYMFYTFDELDLLCWSAKEDMKNEFFPHQIVLVLRLTRPAIKK